MNFLPLLQKELRAKARRPMVHVIRLLPVVLVAALFFEALDIPQKVRLDLAAPAQMLCLLVALFWGMADSAGCFASEKQEGTLELLFQSNLRAWDIFLGKFMASLVAALYDLMSVIPVLAAGLVVWRVFSLTGLAVLVSLVFLALLLAISWGVFYATLFRRSGLATLFTFGTLMLQMIGVPVVVKIVDEFGPGLSEFWQVWGYAASLLLSQSPELMRLGLYWPSICWALSECSILWVITCLILPRMVVHGNLGWWNRWWKLLFPVRRARHTTKHGFFWQLRHGARWNRKRARRMALDRNPVYWLAKRDRLVALCGNAMLAAYALFWLILLGRSLWSHSGILNADETLSHVQGLVILNGIFKINLAFQVTGPLAEARQNGLLEGLFLIPSSRETILRGGALAWRRLMRFPFLLLMGINLIMVFVPKNLASANLAAVLTIIMACVVSLILDALLLGWLGLYFGLRPGSANKAAWAAIGVALYPAWILGVILSVYVMIKSPNAQFQNYLEYYRVWWVFGCVWAIGGVAWCQWQLRRHFQAVITGFK